MYFRGFDGLRALAMFLVFLTHKTAWGRDGQLGFSGVWIFFLLSGYLITAQLHAARGRLERGASTLRGEMTSFWLRRAMRIFPAYYVLIALLVPFYFATGRDVPGLPYYLGYLSNVYFQFHPAEFLTTWAHFWTLAIEEQFYLFFAPLLLAVPSRRAASVCGLLIIVSIAQRFALAGAGAQAYAIYIDSLVNFGLLAFGGLLFLRRAEIAGFAAGLGLDRPGVGWVAMAGVIAMSPAARALAGPDPVLLQALYLVGALLAALLLINLCLNQASGLIRVLEWRPVAYYGRISYGLYLYNDYIKDDIPLRLLRAVEARLWPMGAAPGWLAALTREGTLPFRLVEAAGVALCFALLAGVAHLSWVLVEKSALRLRDRFTGRPGPAVSAPDRGRVANADQIA